MDAGAGELVKPALVEGQLNLEMERTEERIRQAEKLRDGLKAQDADPLQVQVVEEMLERDRRRLEQLLQVMKDESPAWREGQSDTEDLAMDREEIKRLLGERDGSRPDGAVSGDEGGYVIEPSSVGGGTAEERLRALQAHLARSGDHQARTNGAPGTGAVVDPFQRAAESVSQVQTSVVGVKEIKETIEDY
jgi:hypothetical protein